MFILYHRIAYESIVWRWRESNPRAKYSYKDLYKLVLVFVMG